MACFLQLPGDSREPAASQMAVLAWMVAQFLLSSLLNDLRPELHYYVCTKHSAAQSEVLPRSDTSDIAINLPHHCLCTGAGFCINAGDVAHSGIWQASCACAVRPLDGRTKAATDTFSTAELEKMY